MSFFIKHFRKKNKNSYSATTDNSKKVLMSFEIVNEK
jgi:hypothetical protein